MFQNTWRVVGECSSGLRYGYTPADAAGSLMEAPAAGLPGTAVGIPGAPGLKKHCPSGYDCWLLVA
ncbi:MAG: hypothetical protein VX253_13540 [Bacteroidota bacterium]|nr:hypothetical protein [Bacteroidota bacterium]